MRCSMAERRLEYVVASQVRRAIAGNSNHGSHCLNNGSRGTVRASEETARNRAAEGGRREADVAQVGVGTFQTKVSDFWDAGTIG